MGRSDLPYQRHSETSLSAAERMEPLAETLRAEVYGFLLSCGPFGATDEEMQKALPMVNNTQRPRRIELVEQERVFDSGETRKTETGRDAVVWVAQPFQPSVEKQIEMLEAQIKWCRFRIITLETDICRFERRLFLLRLPAEYRDLLS